VVGIGKTAWGFVAPKTADVSTGGIVGQKEAIQGLDTALEKGGLLFAEGGVGASDIAGTIGGESVTWGEIAANPELAFAIAEGGTAVGEIAGSLGGQAVTWADIAANPELVYAIAEGVGVTGGAVAAEVGSVYAGVTAATMADLAGAAVGGAVAGSEVAGVGAASVGAAGAGLAAGLVAIPFLVLAAVNMIEQAKVAAQLEERAAMVKPIFDALTVNGPLGAANWIEASGGWADTGRDNNYLTLGMQVLMMLAFPDAKAENPWLTDTSGPPWEAAWYSMRNAVAEAQGASVVGQALSGGTVQGQAVPIAPRWYLGILRTGRYPSRADFQALTLADLDQSALAAWQIEETRWIERQNSWDSGR
jgi:hypothetical protein